MLPDWQYIDPYKAMRYKVKTRADMPDSAYGFIYEIVFEDGTRYIGKKCLNRTLRLKRSTNKKPKGTIMQVKKKDCYVNTVVKESDWKTYIGSSKLVKGKKVKERFIWEFAYTPLELTYLEAEYLFGKEVLLKEKYLNDNILGSFYKGRLDDLARRRNEEWEKRSSFLHPSKGNKS